MSSAPEAEGTAAYSGWTLDEFRLRGKEANSEGDALLAYDIAATGLHQGPADASLRQIQALALARMGSMSAARELLSALSQETDDEETLELLARTYKDLWLATGSTSNLETARDAYLRAYRRSSERYW